MPFYCYNTSLHLFVGSLQEELQCFCEGSEGLVYLGKLCIFILLILTCMHADVNRPIRMYIVIGITINNININRDIHRYNAHANKSQLLHDHITIQHTFR